MISKKLVGLGICLTLVFAFAAFAMLFGELPVIRANIVRVAILETDTLILEREGLRLHVRDLESGETFTIKPVRVRKTGQDSAGLRPVRSLVQTETILIETAPGVVIVTQKHTGQQFAVRFP